MYFGASGPEPLLGYLGVLSRLEEEPSKRVADPEKDQYHDRDHGRDQAHHREKL